jgi:hypothetical protein
MRFWRSVVGAVLAMALLAGAERAAAQSYPVTFSMQSIMEGFFGETGLVSFRDYDAAFVPAEGELQAEVVLADADGAVLARHPFFDSYRMQTQVFARIGVVGPAEAQLSEPGIYNIFFLVDGEIATRMPFVLNAAGDGSDPFDPEKTYSYDGFWRQLGYMTPPGTGGFQGPTFTFWTGGLDLADPENGEGFVAALYQGDEVLFHSKRTTGHIATGAFKRSTFNLFHPHEAGREANAVVFSSEDLAALDGDYVLRVFRQSDDAVIRAFRLTVAGGELQQHERAVLGYEPQMDFILPRVPRAGSNTYEMVEAIWFESR